MLALAPDDSSRRAAGPLGRPAPWHATGATDDLVWGLCAGSGKNPYQVIIDLAGPAYKCSCPSRKFPCKHALGLLLLWSAGPVPTGTVPTGPVPTGTVPTGTVPDAAEPADFARAWSDARREKAKPSHRTGERSFLGDPSRTSMASDVKNRVLVAADSDPSVDPGAGPAGPRDEAGAARRAAERAERVSAGLADLQEWLRDQVRVGLAVSGAGGAGARPGSGTELMAARMVDAQAPGVADTLRGLSGPGRSGPNGAEEWPARLLAEYGLLHLLARAHEQRDALPPGLAATVRSRVGYPVSKQDVLAGPAVPGRWLVVAVRDLTEGTVPGRRVWLREADMGQWAMLLIFAAPNGAWQDPDSARLRPGSEVRGELHFYPGQPALRAVFGRHEEAAAAALVPANTVPSVPAGDVGTMLAQWAAGLEQDPWLTTWPALLAGTPVPAGGGTSGWLLADQAGRALPLADRESLWTLLAVSGGHPVPVAGEWHPDGNGLVALTTWHGDEVVVL